MSTTKPNSVKLGSTTAPSPAYGLGTAHFNKGAGAVDESLVKHVQDALKAGFVHLDCAEAYNNDASVGEALKRSGVDRSKLFITDKITGSVNDVAGTLQKQLKHLGVDHLDLLLVHDPTSHQKHNLSQAQVWEQMEQVHSQGLVKAIGVSNFRVKHLEELLKTAKVKPVANQVEVHPYVQGENDELVAFCKSHDIAIESYGPTSPLVRAAGGPVDRVVERIAKERGISGTQVLLLWAKRYTNDGVIVTTSGKPERMAEQVAFAGLEALSDADFKAISDAGRQSPPEDKRRFFMAHTA